MIRIVVGGASLFVGGYLPIHGTRLVFLLCRWLCEPVDHTRGAESSPRPQVHHVGCSVLAPLVGHGLGCSIARVDRIPSAGNTSLPV